MRREDTHDDKSVVQASRPWSPEEEGRRALASNRSDTFLRTEKQRYSPAINSGNTWQKKRREKIYIYSRRGLKQSCHSSLPISGGVINFSSLLGHTIRLCSPRQNDIFLDIFFDINVFHVIRFIHILCHLWFFVLLMY